MIAGANADGKRSEKIEVDESLRTVECLRGRLLAERVASKNAKDEVEQMENKLIELEKKLKEESKSRNRAERRLKFLMKKLESLNISYVSDESEQSSSGSLGKSEISSVVSSVASSSTKEAEDKEIHSDVTNSISGDTQEFVQNSKSPPVPENLEQNVGSSAENNDNLAAGETICSSEGVNLPPLTIQKDEIKEYEEKSKSPTISGKSEQNARSSAENHDNPAAGDIVCSSKSGNLPELTIQKEDATEFREKAESPAASNKSEPNAISSAKILDGTADRETVGSRNGFNFPKLMIEKEVIQEFKEKYESPTVSNKSEQNASSPTKNLDDPATGDSICSRNGVTFPEELTIKKEAIEEFKERTESPTVSNKSEQKAIHSSTIKQFPVNPAALETFSLVEAYPANESESSQKTKKSNNHDHSLRTLFEKERSNEDYDQQDDHVDNSLALVPVDLPKPKQTIDPVILDATVKEVLDALRSAKEKLQTSMQRRRSNMIKVG